MSDQLNRYGEENAKQDICAIIEEIYGNNLANNHPRNITPEVIDIVTDAVNRIKSATRALLAVDVTFSFLYTAPGTVKDVLCGIAVDLGANLWKDPDHMPIRTYINWFQALRKKRQYLIAIQSAALATRSGLELALMGI